jgi:hypothetical protein
METKILIKRINGKEMFFEKINKIGKLLAKLTKRKEEKKQINKLQIKKLSQKIPIKFREPLGNI